MKKNLSILIVVLIVLALSTTSVLAAPAAAKNVKFVSVAYQQGGIVLIFETSGLTKADLKDNSFYAASNNQKMTCNFVDDTTKVRCIVSKALAGKGDFHVTLAGFGFWGELPAGALCGEDEVIWYSVNVTFEGETLDMEPIPQWIWNELEELGFFEMFAEEGIIFDTTGRFCAPDIEEEIPT